MKIDRYSCKCKLCKKSWTTTESYFVTAFNAHSSSCDRYAEILTKRTNGNPKRIEGEQWQMAAAYFTFRQIEGYVNSDIKCDGRCMGATGHCCECSCGGVNHGIRSAA